VLLTTPSVQATVHPHACGKHYNHNRFYRQRYGSSPRVWETRFTVPEVNQVLRFIPTRVGNTTFLVAIWYYHPVHPHACGEHSRWPWQSQPGRGSSPRVGGTLFLSCCYLPIFRFIPTRVGNTRFDSPGNQPEPVHPHACGEHEFLLKLSRILVGSSPRVWGTLLSQGRGN